MHLSKQIIREEQERWIGNEESTGDGTKGSTFMSYVVQDGHEQQDSTDVRDYLRKVSCGNREAHGKNQECTTGGVYKMSYKDVEKRESQRIRLVLAGNIGRRVLWYGLPGPHQRHPHEI